MDVILVNNLGMELARESVNFKSDLLAIIANWIICDGDIIRFEGSLIEDTNK